MHEDLPQNHDLSALAMLFSSMLCVCFGGNAVAIKIVLSGLGAYTAAGLRFAMAGTAIFLWAWLTRRRLMVERGQWHKLFIISAIFVLQMSLLYHGFDRTTASRGVLLSNVQPFFVLFLAHYAIPGDQMTRRKCAGLLMGFAGVAALFVEQGNLASDARVGDLLVLSAAFVWACGAVYIKKILNGFQPHQIVLYQMLFSFPFFFLGAFFWDTAMIEKMDSQVIGGLLYQGLVTAALGFVLWIRLLKRYGAVALHSFIFIMPVSGVLLGSLVLKETVTWHVVLSLILIAFGILIVHVRPRKPAPLFLPGRGL